MFFMKTNYENLDWTGLKQDSVLVLSSDNNIHTYIHIYIP
jgi:hypothetical protein